jgi:hypothetical protein
MGYYHYDELIKEGNFHANLKRRDPRQRKVFSYQFNQFNVHINHLIPFLSSLPGKGMRQPMFDISFGPLGEDRVFSSFFPATVHAPGPSTVNQG